MVNILEKPPKTKTPKRTHRSPEYAVEQNSSSNQDRHIGLPLRHKLFQKQQKQFINLVNQVLKKKKQNPNVDTGELEKTIDQLVYRLYNLTKDEIKIVENN